MNIHTNKTCHLGLQRNGRSRSHTVKPLKFAWYLILLILLIRLCKSAQNYTRKMDDTEQVLIRNCFVIVKLNSRKYSQFWCEINLLQN